VRRVAGKGTLASRARSGSEGQLRFPCTAKFRFGAERHVSRGLRRVQLGGRTDEGFKRPLVNVISLVNVDGAPRLALEAGVE
jgi:hypothetical protein